MDYLTTLKEHLRLFWRFKNRNKISDAKSVRCYVELFLRWDSHENPRENQIGRICFWSPRHEQKVTESMSDFFCEKKSPDKARNVPFYVGLLTFEPRHTGTLPALPARTHANSDPVSTAWGAHSRSKHSGYENNYAAAGDRTPVVLPVVTH